MINPVLTFGIAASISYVVSAITIVLAKRFNIVTDKRKRMHPAHTHTGIIPRAGGLPVYVACVAAILLSVSLNKIVIGIIIASTLLLLVGLLDDIHDSSPYLRFIANLLISALVVGFGLGIPFISNPFGAAIRLDTVVIPFTLFGSTHTILLLADILAILWLSWITNLVNWSKGVDGQLPGFVAIAALFLGFLSQRFVAHDLSAQSTLLIAMAISGAYAGFLPFNIFPQKIMPGYGGGALAGFWLGILSILSFGKIGTLLLVLAIPSIDAMYTIVRRLTQHKSPFRADWGHFHHKLMEIGWGKQRIAVFYWIVTLVLGVASLILDALSKLIVFAAVVAMLVLFFAIIERTKKNNEILH